MASWSSGQTSLTRQGWIGFRWRKEGAHLDFLGSNPFLQQGEYL